MNENATQPTLPQDDGVQNQSSIYRFNSNFELTRKQEIDLSRIRHAGVQYFSENGKIFPKNPERANENLMHVQNALVGLYYSLPEFEVLSLTKTKFDELYEPIQQIDPLGLRKEQEKEEENQKAK